MTFGPGRLVIFCGLLPTLVTALLSLTRPAFLRSLEYGTYDRLLRAAETRPPTDRIVIVDIDDRSLTTVGQWPWRRDVVGQLVDRLRNERGRDRRAGYHLRGTGPLRCNGRVARPDVRGYAA